MDGDLRAANAAMLGVAAIDREALDPAVNAIDLILEDRATDGLDILTANRMFVSPGLPLTTQFLDTAVGHDNAGTVIALVNAVYLKARWAVSFNTKEPMAFTTAVGGVVEVPAFGHDDFFFPNTVTRM